MRDVGKGGSYLPIILLMFFTFGGAWALDAVPNRAIEKEAPGYVELKGKDNRKGAWKGCLVSSIVPLTIVFGRPFLNYVQPVFNRFFDSIAASLHQFADAMGLPFLLVVALVSGICGTILGIRVGLASLKEAEERVVRLNE